MDVMNLDHTCSEVNLPLCRIIKSDASKYVGRRGLVEIMDIESPATVAFLVFAVTCTLRLLVNTQKHYAAIGRKEFCFFFYLYLGSLLVDIPLVSGLTAEDMSTHIYLTTIQLSFACTALFSLLVGGITSSILTNIGFFKSIVIVRALSFGYFLVSGSIILGGLLADNGGLLFMILFALNALMAGAYVVTQFTLLVRMNSEVWAYGTLSIACIFFTLAVTILFYGSEPLAFMSDRYMDGLFVFHLFIFCTIIMVHKYWLSICDFEAECASIVVENANEESIVKEPRGAGLTDGVARAQGKDARRGEKRGIRQGIGSQTRQG